MGAVDASRYLCIIGASPRGQLRGAGLRAAVVGLAVRQARDLVDQQQLARHLVARDVRARVLSILRTSEAAGWVEIEEEAQMDASLIEAFAKALGVAVEAIVAALQSQQLELRKVAAPDATKAMHDARNDALSGGK